MTKEMEAKHMHYKQVRRRFSCTSENAELPNMVRKKENTGSKINKEIEENIKEI